VMETLSGHGDGGPVNHPKTFVARRSGDVSGSGAGAEGPAGVKGHQLKNLHRGTGVVT
jgi:hypothetical protein